MRQAIVGLPALIEEPVALAKDNAGRPPLPQRECSAAGDLPISVRVSDADTTESDAGTCSRDRRLRSGAWCGVLGRDFERLRHF
jgi:hypothetical protein